jgi:hypothetical protein
MPFRRGPGALSRLGGAAIAFLALAVAAPGASAQSQPVRDLVQDVTAHGVETVETTRGQVASVTQPVRETVQTTVGDVREVVGQATNARPLAEAAERSVDPPPGLPASPSIGAERGPHDASPDPRDAQGLGAAESLRSASRSRTLPRALAAASAIAAPAAGLLAQIDRPRNAIASALSDSGDGRDGAPGTGPGGGDMAGPIATGLVMAAVLVALLLLAPRIVTRIVRVTRTGGGAAIFFTPIEWPD